MHQIQVGRHHQIADEFAVLLHAHRTHRDFGVAANEVEQADPQVPGKTLVDDFQGWHPAPNDTFLATDVIGPDGAICASSASDVPDPAQ